MRRRSPLRLGFFGGSFDPPHNAHIALADAALRETSLHRIYIIPAARPPHKSGVRLTASRHRLAMLNSVFKGQPRFSVSPWEIRRGGISYTERTLRAFKKRFPGAEWHLLVGGDSLANFKRWKNWRWLLANSRVVVGERKGVARKSFPSDLRARVTFLKKRLPKISSTEIRSLAEAGRSLRGLVPAPVEKYIRRHGFYRSAG